MTNKTPYDTPQADLRSSSLLNNAIEQPRAVDAGNGWSWLANGFDHFRKNPGAWIVVVIAWTVVSLGLSLVPVLGGLAVSLLAPLFTAGVMIGCQAQDEGNDFQVNHLIAGFSKNPGQLLIIGLVYLAASFVIVVFMVAIVGGTMFLSVDTEALRTGDPAAMQGIFENWEVIIIGGLLGLLLFIPTMMLYWFAPALVALHDIPGLQAMGMSFRGCLKNILPFLVYGIIAVFLTILAVIPVFLGLLVVVPMIIASIYTAYRDIFFNQD